MITYADYPLEEMQNLWLACARPGSNAGLLVPKDPTSKSKNIERWVSLDSVMNGRLPFVVDTPKHQLSLDIDEQYVESGLSDQIMQFLQDEGILFVAATSGSAGLTTIINLWSRLTEVEDMTERQERLDDELLEIQKQLKALDPSAGWTGAGGILRPNGAIRPPLSPYTQSGNLKLLFPSSLVAATNCLNFGGLHKDGIQQPNKTLLDHISLQSPVKDRHSRYMSVALALVNAGYHEADFEYLLTKSYAPIKYEYEERWTTEYGRSKPAMATDLSTTWSKAVSRYETNPPISSKRSFLVSWLMASIQRLQDSEHAASTKHKFINFLMAVAHAAYAANTTTPTLAESRLTELSGLGNKTISRYKQIGRELGLWTLSERYTNYGTMFTLQNQDGSTDIKSHYYLLVDREVTSVNHVNDTEINSQIDNWINSWQAHPLWLTDIVRRSNGHLAWSVIQSFPGTTKQRIQDLLQWSPRLVDQTVDALEKMSMVFKDLSRQTYSVNDDLRHWDEIYRIAKPRPVLARAS
ncbi:MAG: hypothetical protein RJB51_361 [Actinomycetota bacterium]